MIAKKEVEEINDDIRQMAYYVPLPYASLAWHYCYGIGCEKNIKEAKRLMRLACKDDGVYTYPSFIQLVKDLGMDSELRYMKWSDWMKL